MWPPGPPRLLPVRCRMTTSKTRAMNPAASSLTQFGVPDGDRRRVRGGLDSGGEGGGWLVTVASFQIEFVGNPFLAIAQQISLSVDGSLPADQHDIEWVACLSWSARVG